MATFRKPSDLSALPTRIHDVTAAMSIGIGMVRAEREGVAASPDGLAVLEASLVDLKHLAISLSGGHFRPPADLVRLLEQEASRLHIKLQLRIDGELAWLPPIQYELVSLFCREGLRNVWRHSGTKTCEIDLRLTGCPVSVWVRDWGAGMLREPRPGSGLNLVAEAAGRSGWVLSMTSHQGMGTEAVLTGPPCGYDRLRSEVNPQDGRRRHKTQISP